MLCTVFMHCVDCVLNINILLCLLHKWWIVHFKTCTVSCVLLTMDCLLCSNNIMLCVLHIVYCVLNMKNYVLCTLYCTLWAFCIFVGLWATTHKYWRRRDMFCGLHTHLRFLLLTLFRSTWRISCVVDPEIWTLFH